MLLRVIRYLRLKQPYFLLSFWTTKKNQVVPADVNFMTAMQSNLSVQIGNLFPVLSELDC